MTRVLIPPGQGLENDAAWEMVGGDCPFSPQQGGDLTYASLETDQPGERERSGSRSGPPASQVRIAEGERMPDPGQSACAGVQLVAERSDLEDHRVLRDRPSDPAADAERLARWLERATLNCAIRAFRRGGEARLELHDDRIGWVRIQVLLCGREVSAELVASSAGVIEELRKAVPRLIGRFADQGLDLVMRLLVGSRKAGRPAGETDDDGRLGRSRETGSNVPGEWLYRPEELDVLA